MVEKTVEVELSNPWDGHAAGERITVPVLEAKKIVRSGYGVYPTKVDAEAAEGEAGDAKTKQAVRKAAKHGG